MASKFFKKSKGPQDVVKHFKESCSVCDTAKPGDKNLLKAVEDASRDLMQFKVIIYGEDGHEPSPDAIQQLMTAVYESDLLPVMIRALPKFEFEAKKDASAVFNNLLRRQQGTRLPTVEYCARHPEVLITLLRGYENPDVALNCGAMLRECVRHESLTKILVYHEDLYRFFQYVEVSNFDIASDAFSTFKELLTKHKVLVAEFLEKNYDVFFEAYSQLVNSQNYVTRRQSLKLLGELLLDRANFNIMTKYIASLENLKLMMRLLRDPSRSIQFEAFHVFKVFVANPSKSFPILELLVRNKERLITFLNSFHNDKEDEQFNEEKSFLLKQIAALQLPEGAAAAAAPGSGD